MLFGVSFCRRGTKVKKRRPGPGWDPVILLALLAAAVFAALLFIAPQWLLAVLVVVLAAALAAFAVRCGRK